MQYINNEYATAKVRDEYMERIQEYMNPNPKPRNRAERRKHNTSKRKERFYE